MTVTAIRCEACEGSGRLVWSLNHWRALVECPVCTGTGIERPPQDHDNRARQAIEKTETDDE